MSAVDAVVYTEGLTKCYDGADAVRALGLVVPRHSIFGFLGPNGAGKTTTMKMLLGLIRPTEGSGTIFGLDIVSDSPDIRAYRVSASGPEVLRAYDRARDVALQATLIPLLPLSPCRGSSLAVQGHSPCFRLGLRASAMSASPIGSAVRTMTALRWSESSPGDAGVVTLEVEGRSRRAFQRPRDISKLDCQIVPSRPYPTRKGSTQSKGSSCRPTT